MAAGDFNFNFSTVKPSSGWTANSIVKNTQSAVGPVNAAAQTPVTAANLRTTPSTLRDPSLGSRTYQNPNTGVRDPVLSGSVYAQGNVPSFLTQAVTDLNAEQALRRSLQAEWNNRLFSAANSNDPNAFLFQEALRAASVTPGASVAFGSAVQNPLIGQGYNQAAQASASLDQSRSAAVASPTIIQSRLQQLRAQPLSPTANYWEISARQRQIADLEQQLRNTQPIAISAASAPRSSTVLPSYTSQSGWVPITASGRRVGY